jgi:hypothetical protein
LLTLLGGSLIVLACKFAVTFGGVLMGVAVAVADENGRLFVRGGGAQVSLACDPVPDRGRLVCAPRTIQRLVCA